MSDGTVWVCCAVGVRAEGLTGKDDRKAGSMQFSAAVLVSFCAFYGSAERRTLTFAPHRLCSPLSFSSRSSSARALVSFSYVLLTDALRRRRRPLQACPWRAHQVPLSPFAQETLRVRMRE